MAEYIDRAEYCEKHCRCSNEYCDKESCPIWKAPAAKDVLSPRGGVQGRQGNIFPGGGADMSEFPERLRKLREKKRLKRYVLSERCGLNSDAIRRYELGTAKPTMDALKSIADEFGVSVDYLMGRTDYPCVVDIAEK